MRSKALESVLNYYDIRGEELFVGGLPISQLAEQYPTPFYVYDLHVARKKYYKLRNALPKEIEIHYAIKANPNPEVIRFFKMLGVGFDVASKGELNRALQSGVKPNSCSFAGPGKSLEELKEAILCSIGSLNVESKRELQIINELAEQLGRKANISLRINPAFQLKGSGMHIGGGAQPFGIDQEQIPDLLAKIPQMRGLNFIGFHLFAGSQNLKAEAIVNFSTMSFSLLKELLMISPSSPSMINLGGGFGIPYYPSDDELDIEAVGEGLARLLKENREFFPATRFVVETGRYLIGESGIYVTRVRYKKKSRGELFLIVDGGLNHNLAATGNLGQVIRRNYPIAPLEKLGEEAIEKVNIVGPLCTPLDVLGTGVELTRVDEGDLVGIFASGAYGFSASPRSFLSHPEPIEIVVDSAEDR